MSFKKIAGYEVLLIVAGFLVMLISGVLPPTKETIPFVVGAFATSIGVISLVLTILLEAITQRGKET